MPVRDEALRVREPLDEVHEPAPLPVLARVGVIVDAAALERVVRVGHLVVPDDVMPVDRDHERRAITAAIRAAARYSLVVKPAGSSVNPMFSIPTERTL